MHCHNNSISFKQYNGLPLYSYGLPTAIQAIQLGWYKNLAKSWTTEKLFDSLEGKRSFLSSKGTIPAQKPIQSGALSQVVKRPEREAGNFSPFV